MCLKESDLKLNFELSKIFYFGFLFFLLNLQCKSTNFYSNFVEIDYLVKQTNNYSWVEITGKKKIKLKKSLSYQSLNIGPLQNFISSSSPLSPYKID